MEKKEPAIIKRKITGVVISDAMNKTRVVAVYRFKKHQKYKKYYRVTTKFKAHDPENHYKVNDRVVIEETRPMSKEKRWIIVGTA